jgi:hypothetical protein
MSGIPPFETLYRDPLAFALIYEPLSDCRHEFLVGEDLAHHTRFAIGARKLLFVR